MGQLQVVGNVEFAQIACFGERVIAAVSLLRYADSPDDPASSQRRGRGPRGNRVREPSKPGPRVTPDEVAVFPKAPLYEPTVFRTVFLEFESDDWEQELESFHGTDVEVPATLIVDGQRCPRVGVRFRGKSSYGMVPAGHKRSFNVSLDLADKDQRLYGFKTLNLLNSAGDPTLMSPVLYSSIGNQYLPVPKANHVRVVVNGESWGVYVNVQQFDKIFLKEHYGSSKGTRWKVSGSPNADGGLRYLGEDLEEYKRRYEMKSNDGKKAWNALIDLCRKLEQTPPERLVEELSPILDIDETLRFLALDLALVNSDGYWTRASDYSIYRDKDGRFHMIPHDINEAFKNRRGGGRRGPGGGPGFGPPGGPPAGGDFGPPRGRGPADRISADPTIPALAGRAVVAVAGRAVVGGADPVAAAPNWIRWSRSTTPACRCTAACSRCPNSALAIWNTSARSPPSRWIGNNWGR